MKQFEQMKIVDLSATVYHKELNIQMGESSLSWCTYLSKDTAYGGNRRYLTLMPFVKRRNLAQKLTSLTQLRQPQ